MILTTVTIPFIFYLPIFDRPCIRLQKYSLKGHHSNTKLLHTTCQSLDFVHKVYSGVPILWETN